MTKCARIVLLLVLFGWMQVSSISAQQELTDEDRAAQALDIRCLAFSPDGKFLAAATGRAESRGSVTVWNLETKTSLWVYREEIGLPSIDFSPDGKLIAVGRYAHAAKILDAATGNDLATLEGHANHVRCVRFSPDGAWLFTGSADRTVKIWDMKTRSLDATLGEQSDGITSLDISKDGSLLAAVASKAKTTWIWDLKTRLPLLKLPVREASVFQAVFSPDGKSLLEATAGDACRIIGMPNGEPVMPFLEHHGVKSIAISQNEEWIAIADYDLMVNRFSVPRAAVRPGEIEDLIGKLKLLDYATREEATRRLSDMGLLAEPQLSVAMNSESAEVRWRTRRLREKLLSTESAILLMGHNGDVRYVQFSPDGQFLASGDSLGEVRVWRVGTWAEHLRFAVDPLDTDPRDSE